MRLLLILCGLLLAFPTAAQEMLSGNTSGSAPANSVGAEGKFFLDSSTGNIYGPKSFGVWPTPPRAPAIQGSTSGNAPAAGAIGEDINSSIPAGSAVSLTSTVAANVTSVSLTPGNWLCYGTVAFTPGGTTTTSVISAAINTTSATLPTIPNSGSYFHTNIAIAAGLDFFANAGQRMIRTSSAATAYLVVNATFAVSTLSAYGYLGCVRQP